MTTESRYLSLCAFVPRLTSISCFLSSVVLERSGNPAFGPNRLWRTAFLSSVFRILSSVLYICKEHSTNRPFLCKTKPNLTKIGKIGKTKPALSLCPKYEPVLSVAERVKGVEWVKIGKISPKSLARKPCRTRKNLYSGLSLIFLLTIIIMSLLE
jgi:hypothetical protein